MDASNFVPAIPSMKMHTQGQGYGDWKKYAFHEQVIDQQSKPVVPPEFVDTSVPAMSYPPVPIGASKPFPQNPENPNADQTSNSPIGDSWYSRLTSHFGPY